LLATHDRVALARAFRAAQALTKAMPGSSPA
jgi:hypothetical protein